MGYADVSELEKYKLVSNIGKGSFGVISKVQRVEDGKVGLSSIASRMLRCCPFRVLSHHITSISDILRRLSMECIAERSQEFALKQLDYSKMTEKDRKQILAEV